MESPGQNRWIYRVRNPFIISQEPYPLLARRRFPDRVRGVLNEGGLFGERAGWHLPEFDTSNWLTRNLSDGLPNDAAGVGFFVTNFPLQIPPGFDVMLSFNFDESSQPYRALLFVNGWMMGKRVANLGYGVSHILNQYGSIDDDSFVQPPSQVPCTSGNLRLQWNQVRASFY